MGKRVRIGPPKVGPKMVSKIRRTQTQAYGDRKSWSKTSLAVKTRDGFRCRLCPRTTDLQVDHIIPVSRGGLTIMRNLWTLCAICHSKRPGHRVAKALILHKRNKRLGKK